MILTAITAGASRVASGLLCVHAIAITPAGLTELVRSSLSVDGGLPCVTVRSAPAIAFSRPAQRSLTLWPARSRSRHATLYTEGSDSFVASAAASIATGWSEPVPGRELHPLKVQRLSRRTVTLANGRQILYSLPIPLERSTCGYEDIRWRDTTLHAVISGLRNGKTPVGRDSNHFDHVLGIPNTPHLDPDLDISARPREEGWRPIFGQSGTQEKQLSNAGVTADPISKDLGSRPIFLFFGWYREAEETRGNWRFVPGSPNLHVVFGWLQVDQKCAFSGRSERLIFRKQNPWARHHPHIACSYYDDGPNAVYLAPDPRDGDRNRLVIGDELTSLPAAGLFKTFVPDVHILTWLGPCPVDKRQTNRRTHWKLPLWFYNNGTPTLGMHDKNPRKRWRSIEGEFTHLVSVGRGQEFVLDTTPYDLKTVSSWVKGMVAAGN